MTTCPTPPRLAIVVSRFNPEVTEGLLAGTRRELDERGVTLLDSDVFHAPGAVVVDTHCIRISNLLGLVDDLKEPAKIETALRQILPPEQSSDFCHRIVLHGRAVCVARRPDCQRCCCHGPRPSPSPCWRKQEPRRSAG